jgi:uncharacterized membrane protein
MEVVQTESSMMCAGPLPPPGILAGYEDALPGAADRIVSMAEANNAANIAMAGAVYCASIGQTKVTYALLGVGALGTISVFVNAWYKGNPVNGE